MRRVRLRCGHFIQTTGDKTQPLEIGKVRWCGECCAWRAIQQIGEQAHV